MAETPQDISFEELVVQAGNDVVAAEKLQILEAQKRDSGKALGEKQR
jgi:hypothetical protein